MRIFRRPMVAWCVVAAGGFLAACTSPPYQTARMPQVGAEVPPEVEYWRDKFAGAEGVQLFEQGWRPTHKPRAAVVFVHDLKDHSSRYRDLGVQLAHRGVAFYSFDLRGHGYSEGVRDHISSLDVAVEDLSILVARVRDRQPGAPLFLVGQGFGASLAALYDLRAKPKLAGLVLAAPWLRGEVGRGERFGLRLAAIFGSKTHKLELNLDDWSSDPKVVAALKADPLIYDGEVTAGTARELVRLSDEVKSAGAAISTPVLVLFGSGDRVSNVEVGKALEASFASTDKKLQVYEGAAHDVFHEPNRREVIGDVLNWVGNHAAASVAAEADEAQKKAAEEAAKAEVLAKVSAGKKSEVRPAKLVRASQKSVRPARKKVRKSSAR